MRKQKSEFAITPDEELDLMHQGSLGGQQLIGKHGREVIQSNVSGLNQRSSQEISQKPVEGPGVSMSAPPQEQPKQEHPERKFVKEDQAKSSKKHHYK